VPNNERESIEQAPMIEFHGRGILLDIEGTTSSIAFVFDVMFPFVRRHLDGYLAERWADESTKRACDLLAQEAGHESLDAWTVGLDDRASQQRVADEVRRLMDADVKSTGLKDLQGSIWQAGFASGELVSHVYPDVPPALERWRELGLDVRVYSSGSIAAQKLFFGHTEYGDLLAHFSGHYDTTIGSKRERDSYARIADDWRIPPADILFLSDVVAELDAARVAGLRTGLALRPGNHPQSTDHGHPSLTAFDQVTCVRRSSISANGSARA
jgi:enolase-phosphatase E1